MLLFPLYEFLSISLQGSYRLFCCHFFFVFFSFVCFSWTSSGLFLCIAHFFSLFLSLCHSFYVPVCLFNFFLFKENIFWFVTLLPSIAGHLNIFVSFCLTTFLSILLPIVSLPFSLSICLSECLYVSLFFQYFFLFFCLFISGCVIFEQSITTFFLIYLSKLENDTLLNLKKHWKWLVKQSLFVTKLPKRKGKSVCKKVYYCSRYFLERNVADVLKFCTCDAVKNQSFWK